jgi:hypothetical protein
MTIARDLAVTAAWMGHILKRKWLLFQTQLGGFAFDF